MKNRAKIFDDLVGTWDVAYTDFLKDGKVKHASGEFIVGWVLDGRVVEGPDRIVFRSQTRRNAAQHAN
jgi:hypothetical protein